MNFVTMLVWHEDSRKTRKSIRISLNFSLQKVTNYAVYDVNISN